VNHDGAPTAPLAAEPSADKPWSAPWIVVVGMAVTHAFSGMCRNTTEFSGAVLASETAPVGGIYVPDFGSIRPRQLGGHGPVCSGLHRQPSRRRGYPALRRRQPRLHQPAPPAAAVLPDLAGAVRTGGRGAAGGPWVGQPLSGILRKRAGRRPGGAGDPRITCHNGWYYYVENPRSRGPRVIDRSKSLIDRGEPRTLS